MKTPFEIISQKNEIACDLGLIRVYYYECGDAEISHKRYLFRV